jgi:hypothetical protein
MIQPNAYFAGAFGLWITSRGNVSEPANFAATIRRGLKEYQPALNIGHTSASNSELLGTQQAIGRIETLPQNSLVPACAPT